LPLHAGYGKILSYGKEIALFGISENGLDDFPDMPYHTSSESPDKVKIT
jgi:hypothetical protein